MRCRPAAPGDSFESSSRGIDGLEPVGVGRRCPDRDLWRSDMQIGSDIESRLSGRQTRVRDRRSDHENEGLRAEIRLLRRQLEEERGGRERLLSSKIPRYCEARPACNWVTSTTTWIPETLSTFAATLLTAS
jgi:hypothetical protein